MTNETADEPFEAAAKKVSEAHEASSFELKERVAKARSAALKKMG